MTYLIPSAGPRNVGPGLHVVDAHQRFYGLPVGARMTVVNIGDDLLIHSPVAVDPYVVEHLGNLRWVIAPNLLHHLYVGPWVDAGAEAWGPTGLPEKRADVNFAGVLAKDENPFDDDIELIPLTCFDFTNEIAVFHRPSRTLIVADLVFNFPSTAALTTRAAMWWLGGYPGCRTTLLEQFGMNREVAREEIGKIADLDFDRLIMSHGDIIESGGREAFRNAFHWLW